MELIKLVKRKTFLHEVAYVALNVGLSLSMLFLIKITGFLWPSFLLVLLSKWRIFAVRPRFWFANIQTNIVSLIVSISYIVFLYNLEGYSMSETNILIAQMILVVLDCIWLLYIKPKSKRVMMAVQSGIAIFVGTMALSLSSFDWFATPVVLIVWLIGYASARHILGSYDDEEQMSLLSLVWGLVMAEIGWLAYHWTTGYGLSVPFEIVIPQFSILALVVSFLAYKAYDSYHHKGEIKFGDIVLPLVFTVSIVSLMLLAFNSVSS